MTTVESTGQLESSRANPFAWLAARSGRKQTGRTRRSQEIFKGADYRRYVSNSKSFLICLL